MIPAQEHSRLIAKKVVGKFEEKIPVRNGFSGFFKKETTSALMVDVEVQRDNDFIAVDVKRFAEGNHNTYTRSTEHTYLPPFYKEIYDFNRDDVYLKTVAQGVTNNVGINQAISKNALKALTKNKNKILRAIQKQQADVMQYGVVTMKNGDTIDYRRKSESMVDLTTGNYWNEESTDPKKDFTNAMKFLRSEGNSSGESINAVMREEAMNALLANAAMQKLLDSRRIDRGKIIMPQFDNTTGMAFQGQIAAGDFVLNLWTYNEKYKDPETLEDKYYLDRENVVVIPNDFQGKQIYGGLPYMRTVIMGGQSVKMPSIMEKDFLVRAYSDEKTISSSLELTSAPVSVPFTIDKIYTMKVLASL